MTWDLDDKYLALSLLYDQELSPADQARVDARLQADADWQATFAALRDTERHLAATIGRRAVDPLGAAIEATLERYLRDHRLDPDAFPHRMLLKAFPHLTDAWFARVLQAHRLDEKFVRQVSDASRIAGFQEPLDAQLREAFQAHRVGAAFVEKIVGESQGSPTPVPDLPTVANAVAAVAGATPTADSASRAAALRGPGSAPPTPATTAAVSPTPARGAGARNRTPQRALTPAGGQPVALPGVGQRTPSGRLLQMSASGRLVPGLLPDPANKIRRVHEFRRYGPAVLAAAVLLIAAVGYALYRPPVALPSRQQSYGGSLLSAQVYTRQRPTSASARSLELAGLRGLYPLDNLSADHRSVATGADGGQVVALADPQTNVPIARVVLDADTIAQFYGPGETIPGVGMLARGGVILQQGSLLADVDKSGRSFQVLTPDPVRGGYDAVIVRGTRFYVRADRRAAGVDVLEGVVSFVADAARHQAEADAPGAVAGLELYAGSRYRRNLEDGTQRLLRLDPGAMTYPFMPAELTVSRWVQVGGGLERGHQLDRSLFEHYRPTPVALPQATFFAPPVVLPDGRGLALRRQDGAYAWCLLTPDPAAAAAVACQDVATALPVSARLRFGPVLLPRQMVALVVGNTLQTIRTADWQAAWSLELPADLDINAFSVGPRGMLVLSTSQGLWAYDGATGTPLWRNQTVGEILSGIAASEQADEAFLVAYDSIRGRLFHLDPAGRLLKSIELRADEPATGLAQDLKNWTLHGAPAITGDNCALVFEDGATAFVNLTTGARRMTAGFGLTERVRLATIDRKTLSLSLLLQSGQLRRIDLAAAPNGQAAPATDASAQALLARLAAPPVGLAVAPAQAWTVDTAGRLQVWLPPAGE